MNSKYCYSNLESVINRKSVEHYTSNDEVSDNPVDMCLFSDVNKSFGAGVLGYRYGPANENCQLFMADRCAKNWDGICDIASLNNQAIYPNNATIKGNAFSNPAEITGGSTVGNQLLHNAAQRRFCVFNNCSVQQFPFDPTNYASPMVTRINRSQYGCMPTCSVDPKSINSDTLMNKCLDNPGVAFDTLVNICQTHERSGVSLKGTRIGQFCDSLKGKTKQPLQSYYPR
jgi:hypothetical protein